MTKHSLKPNTMNQPLTLLSSASLVVLVGSLGVVHSNSAFAVTRQACDIQASPDIASTSTDAAVNIDVLENDGLDVDKNRVFLDLDENTLHRDNPDFESRIGGKLTTPSSSQVTYTPPKHFRGQDTFYYRAYEVDWRGPNGIRTFNASDLTLEEKAPPAATASGDIILDAGSFGVWPGDIGKIEERYIGRIVSPTIDGAQLCRTGIEDSGSQSENITLDITWRYEKSSGARDPLLEPIQIVITPEQLNPESPEGITVNDIQGSINEEQLTTRLQINNITAAEMESLQLGFYALNYGLTGYHEWVTQSPIMSGTIDVSNCELCYSETTVTVFVGADKDTDNDGIDDSLDIDKDNDGILDILEGFDDPDNDGYPSDRDLDSDNDGVVDRVELGLIDADQNGLIDTFVDENNDGMDDTAYANALDIIADDAGIAVIGNIDPRINYLPDADNDGLANINDVDSDNDLLADIIENGGIDLDGDAQIDNLIDDNEDGMNDRSVGNTLDLIDVDFDGMPNAFDTNADNDETEEDDPLYDIIEVNAGDFDSNNNGVSDYMEDTDGDGIPNRVDSSTTGQADTDNDFIDDRYDASITGLPDFDDDGIIDSADPDRNGDGMDDRFTRHTGGSNVATIDTDGDTRIDPLDRENNIFNDPNTSVNTGTSGGAALSLGLLALLGLRRKR